DLEVEVLLDLEEQLDHRERVEPEILAQAVLRADLADVALQVLRERGPDLAGDRRLRSHEALPFRLTIRVWESACAGARRARFLWRLPEDHRRIVAAEAEGVEQGRAQRPLLDLRRDPRQVARRVG